MRLAVALLVLGSSACIGEVGAPTGRGGGGAGGAAGAAAGSDVSPPEVLPDGSFACDPDSLTVTPLRRLSATQVRNTIRDLFGADGVDAAGAAADEIARLPLDVAPFEIMDSRLSDQHVRAFYRIAD